MTTLASVVPVHLIPLSTLAVEAILSIHTILKHTHGLLPKLYPTNPYHTLTKFAYLITATIASEALIHPTAIPWLVLPGTAVILIITHLRNADAHLSVSTVKLSLRVTLRLCCSYKEK